MFVIVNYVCCELWVYDLFGGFGNVLLVDDWFVVYGEGLVVVVRVGWGWWKWGVGGICLVYKICYVNVWCGVRWELRCGFGGVVEEFRYV